MSRQHQGSRQLKCLINYVIGWGSVAFLLASQSVGAQPRPANLGNAQAAIATPSQAGLTVPSLWWAQEQFGGKLIAYWQSYSPSGNQDRRVDMVVRPEIWSLLDYWERYRFTNQLGLATSDYGYNLQVFDRERNLLAAYRCDFTQVVPQKVEGARDANGQAIFHYGLTTASQAPPLLPCQLQLNPSP